MAKTTHLLNFPLNVFFLLSILSLFPFLALANSWRFFPRSKTTTTLDVTSSLQKISQSSIAQNNIEQFYTTNSTSSLVLTIHSRNPLLQNNSGYSYHQNDDDDDYTTLLLTRLARDSIRLNTIRNQLDVAIESNLRAPIISGTSRGSGEYFSLVGIGNPPREIYVIIDTGSDLSWVQCQPCTQCYTQPNPIFDPTQSSTFGSLPCNSTQCTTLEENECHGGSCIYEVSYGDGSYTTGNFVTETITFDGGYSMGNIAIGCGHNNDGFFSGAGGLLGLGGGSLSLPSQINATFFSYCLVDRDSNSTSTLYLDINSSILPPDPLLITAPLLRNPLAETFYYLGLTGLSVGGTLLSIPTTSFQIDKDGNGGVIIDSGTAVTRLESRVYELLRDEFRRGMSHLPRAEEVAIFDTCYDLRGHDSVEVPAIELHFAGGKSLGLPAKNYVIPLDTEGTFCMAFAPTTTSMSIIGNVQQEGIRVGFNLVYSLVTFEPNEC